MHARRFSSWKQIIHGFDTGGLVSEVFDCCSLTIGVDVVGGSVGVSIVSVVVLSVVGAGGAGIDCSPSRMARIRTPGMTIFSLFP